MRSLGVPALPVLRESKSRFGPALDAAIDEVINLILEDARSQFRNELMKAAIASNQRRPKESAETWNDRLKVFVDRIMAMFDAEKAKGDASYRTFLRGPGVVRIVFPDELTHEIIKTSEKERVTDAAKKYAKAFDDESQRTAAKYAV